MDWGRLLENFVFMELRRRDLHIDYYRTENGLEVDFITTEHNGTRALYQVSLDMRDVRTHQREVQALTTAMQETGLSKGCILTLESEERIETDNGLIKVMPAWLWAVKFQGQ
jgi:predicted AAA+ superfamily ATPase